MADDYGVDENPSVDIATIAGGARPLSPSQQAVTKMTGGAGPNTEPAIVNNEINVGSYYGRALQSFIDANRPYKNYDPGFGAATSTLSTGIADKATAEATKASIDAAVARHIQQMDNQTRLQLGILPGAGSMTVAALSAGIRDKEQNVLRLEDSIRGDLGVGFLDNPIKWLTNQFTMPGRIMQLGGAEEEVKQNMEVLSGINKLMDEAHRDHMLAAADTSIAAEQNARAMIFAQAKIDLGKVMHDAAVNNVSVVNIRTAANSREFQAVTDSINIQNKSVENAIRFNELSLQDERNQREAAAAKQQQLMNDINIGDKQRADAANAQLQVGLDKAASTGLIAPIKVDNLKFLSPQLQAYVLELAADPNINSVDGALGRNPYKAWERVSKAPITPPPGLGTLANKMSIVNEKTITDTGEFTFKALPPALQEAKLNDGLKKAINDEIKAIPTTGGFFSPGPLASVLAIQEISKLPLAKDLTPQAAQNTDGPTRAQDILAAAVLGVQSGKYDMNSAVQQVNKIYEAIIADNNMKYPYKRMAFDGPNSSTGFKTAVTLGSFGSRTVIDMTNAGAVYDALTRMTLRGAGSPVPAPVVTPPSQLKTQDQP